MELLNLPEHILIKICGYSDVPDLKNLMLTCTYLDDLISINKKLMAKFCFKWSPVQQKSILQNSVRKFRKVRMNLDYNASKEMSSIMDLYDVYASTLEEVDIRFDKLKASDLNQMIKYLAPSNKVKIIRFKLVNYKRDVPFTADSIRAIESLKELNFTHSDCRILKYFQAMKLTTFEYSIYKPCEEHVTSLTSFLTTQRYLETLILSAGAIPNVFREDVSEIFSFNLQELKLFVNNLTEIQSANLNRFLRKQGGSMKSLKVIVQGGDFQSVVTMLDRVYAKYIEVKFHSFNFSNEFIIGNMNNVTHLVIDTKEYPKRSNMLALYLARNLAELTLINVEFNFPMFEALKYFPKLKKLNFIQGTMATFGTISSVTEMSFDNYNFMHIANVVRLNKQLTTLHVGGEEHIDAPYLKLILNRYKHVRTIDFSDTWVVDRICLDALFKYIGDVNIVLPKYLKTSGYMSSVPQFLVRNVTYK